MQHIEENNVIKNILPKCLLAVVRVKGSVNMRSNVKRTLIQLKLPKTFSVCLVPQNQEYLGMLNIAKDVICWGEIEKDKLTMLLIKRGRMIGDKKLTNENLQIFSNIKNIEELIDNLYSCKFRINKVKGLKPFFRLSPPKKGFPKRKKISMGNIGKNINVLLSRMI